MSTALMFSSRKWRRMAMALQPQQLSSSMVTPGAKRGRVGHRQHLGRGARASGPATTEEPSAPLALPGTRVGSPGPPRKALRGSSRPSSHVASGQLVTQGVFPSPSGCFPHWARGILSPGCASCARGLLGPEVGSGLLSCRAPLAPAGPHPVWAVNRPDLQMVSSYCPCNISSDAPQVPALTAHPVCSPQRSPARRSSLGPRLEPPSSCPLPTSRPMSSGSAHPLALPPNPQPA